MKKTKKTPSSFWLTHLMANLTIVAMQVAMYVRYHGLITQNESISLKLIEYLPEFTGHTLMQIAGTFVLFSAIIAFGTLTLFLAVWWRPSIAYDALRLAGGCSVISMLSIGLAVAPGFGTMTAEPMLYGWIGFMFVALVVFGLLELARWVLLGVTGS